jgi:hypothetical protein
MADEITVGLTMSATKTGSGSVSTPRLAFQADMAGNNLVGGVTQDIGTSAEAVTFGDIAAAPAIVAIQNLDTANYVEVGGDSGLTVFTLKLLAGESVLFRSAVTPLYAKANTAAVRIQKWAA